MLKMRRTIEVDQDSLEESVELARRIKTLKELTPEERQKILDIEKQMLITEKELLEARQLGKAHLAMELVSKVDNLRGARANIGAVKYREIQQAQGRLNELTLAVKESCVDALAALSRELQGQLFLASEPSGVA